MAINSLQERYNSLRSLIVPLIRDQVGITCIIAGQAAPRPDLPYASVQMMDNVDEIGYYDQRMTQDGQEYNHRSIELSVVVNVFTDSGTRFDNADNEALTLLEDLKQKLDLPANKEAFRQQEIPYIDGGLINSNSVILNTTFEPRAAVTLRFRSAVLIGFESGAIESVNIGERYINGNVEIDGSISVNK